VRDFHDDDIDQVVRVWDESRLTEMQPVYGLAEVLAAARNGGLAVVAVHADTVVGAAVARVAADRAWVLLLALASEFRGRGVGSAMLAELEKRATAAGVHRLGSLLPPGRERGKGVPELRLRDPRPHLLRAGHLLQAQEVIRLDELGRADPAARALGGTGRDGKGERGHRALSVTMDWLGTA